MVSRQHDIGSQITGRRAVANTSVTAGSTADGQEIDGSAIDRLTDNVFNSGKVVVPVLATLAATETITVAANIQDSPTSTAWTDYVYAQQGSTAISFTGVLGDTASTAAQSIDSVVEFDVDLGAAEQYVRVQMTPTLSNSSADTTQVSGVLILGGGHILPPA